MMAKLHSAVPRAISLQFLLQLLKCIPNLSPAHAITYTNVFPMYFFAGVTENKGLHGHEECIRVVRGRSYPRKCTKICTKKFNMIAIFGIRN